MHRVFQLVEEAPSYVLTMYMSSRLNLKKHYFLSTLSCLSLKTVASCFNVDGGNFKKLSKMITSEEGNFLTPLTDFDHSSCDATSFTNQKKQEEKI